MDDTTDRSQEQAWRELDQCIRQWWDSDIVDLADPATTYGVATPIPVPRPYVAAATTGTPEWYRAMFNWDAYFTGLGLLAHGRGELVRDLIENYLHLVDLLGYMPNANQQEVSTRSQPPLLPDLVERYLHVWPDADLLARAYPLLVKEYDHYWLAPHHSTPCGLATCRDLHDPTLDPRLSAEAESGLDWASLYDGDIRDVAPLVVNCPLVRYAEVLAAFADQLDLPGESSRWRAEAQDRAELVRRLCWNDSEGFFYDYDHVRSDFVTGAGATGFWPLWAGIATPEQAARCAEFLPRLLHPYGLSTTETAPTSSPFGKMLTTEDLQWTHPAGWPPLQVMAAWGLSRCGHEEEASAVSGNGVRAMLAVLDAKGQLFEKYNVLDGTIELPNARYGTLPLHGWSSAAAVLLGAHAFKGRTIDAQLSRGTSPGV